MQWDSSPNAGFTAPQARPWLAVNPNYPEINAAQALGDRHSIYHFMQELLRLRRGSLALVYGDYVDHAPDRPELFLYSRTLGTERYLVAMNFSRKNCSVPLPQGWEQARVIHTNMSSAATAQPMSELAPWEARLLSA